MRECKGGHMDSPEIRKLCKACRIQPTDRCVDDRSQGCMIVATAGCYPAIMIGCNLAVCPPPGLWLEGPMILMVLVTVVFPIVSTKLLPGAPAPVPTPGLTLFTIVCCRPPLPWSSPMAWPWSKPLSRLSPVCSPRDGLQVGLLLLLLL